jgi:hypothetical protein
MTIRAVDPVARRPLPEGEIGELAVRSVPAIRLPQQKPALSCQGPAA